MTTKTVPFVELRRFLRRLHFQEKAVELADATGHVFHQRGKNLLAYRRYNDHQMVSARDLWNTRMYLDDWGLLAAADFDAFLEQATPA